MSGYRTTLAVLALLSSSTAALAAPAVTLSVSIGSPTQKVTVSATGFTASTPLDIFFDTADVCLTIANASGAASCTITVPKDAQPQQHWITAMNRSGTVGTQLPFTVRTDMPQFHGRNARHTGVNPFENTLDVNNVGDLDLLWSVQTGTGSTGIYGSPVVSGGIVYVGAYEGGKLYAFNATTGAPIAGFPVQAGTKISESTPAVAAGKVFIGSYSDSKLYGFNAATGATLAGFPVTLGGVIESSSPAIANGNVYIGCNDGKLYAFNITTGAAVPGFPVTTTAGTFITGSPTIAGPNVYVGSSDHKLYAFDALTGVLRYSFTTGGIVYSTLAAAGSSGFFGSGDSKIYGIRLADGGSLGGFPVATASLIQGTPAVARNTVFDVSFDRNLYASPLHGGAARLTAIDTASGSSPMVANGVVYLQSSFRLYAVSASTGGILWSTGVFQNGLGSPVVANGIVYIADSWGTLYAYTVNGLAPSARLPGGALGVKPALSALKPDRSLKPGQPRLAPAPEDE